MKMTNLSISVLIAVASTSAFAGKQLKPIEPILVTIPAGSFDMGSEDRASSQPIHKVNIKEFSMGKYEVTVAEFARFVKATNYPVPQECRHELNGWFRPYTKGNYENNKLNTSQYQPVVCINWNAADAYIKWLAKETGKPYRLPTEAEWEYAARAGTTTDYFFGNDEDRTQVCQYANTADLYGENILQRETNTSYQNWSTGMANCVDHSAYASIVGMYKPNPFGLHDIVSNVLEFLADCYTENYDNAPNDGSAVQQEDCERRATRGGSWHWNNWPHANRGSIPVDFAGGVDGFRLALDGQAPKQSKQTKYFANALKQEQQSEQMRRDSRHEFPEAVTGLAINQDDNKVTLNWDKSAKEDVTYRVYRNKVQGTMFKLLATNLENNQFVDPNPKSHKYDYTVVAVQNHMQSMYASSVSTDAGWLSSNARLEAQWAAGYEGTVLTQTSDESGGYNFTGAGGISDGASITFNVMAEKTGRYKLQYRVATPRDTKGFELIHNDKTIGINSVVKTGGYHEWDTQNGTEIYLQKGQNTITLKSLDNNWKLNWLSLN